METLTQESVQRAIRSQVDVEVSCRMAKTVAASAGFSGTQLPILQLITSELATNVLVHCGGGEVSVEKSDSSRMSVVQVVATDQGPGISDILWAFEPGNSTKPGTLGEGLDLVARLADTVEVSTGPNGTRIAVQLWKT